MEQWNILLDWDSSFKETQRSLTGFNSDLNSTFNGFVNRIMAIKASQPAAIPGTFDRVMNGAGAGIFGIGVGTGKQIMNSQLKKLINKNTILGNRNKQLQGYLDNIQKAPMGSTPDSVKYLKFNKPTMKKFKPHRVASLNSRKTDLRRDKIATERTGQTQLNSSKGMSLSDIESSYNAAVLKEVPRGPESKTMKAIKAKIAMLAMKANEDQTENFINALKSLNNQIKTLEKMNFK